jgi:hypothetical protein
VKLMRVMLSNGATLQMPTPALKTRPYYAKQVCTKLQCIRGQAHAAFGGCCAATAAAAAAAAAAAEWAENVAAST